MVTIKLIKSNFRSEIKLTGVDYEEVIESIQNCLKNKDGTFTAYTIPLRDGRTIILPNSLLTSCQIEVTVNFSKETVYTPPVGFSVLDESVASVELKIEPSKNMVTTYIINGG